MLSQEYLAWNTAITETIYINDAAGTPVYLDLDDDKFADIAAHPALSGLDASKDGLALAVRNEINLSASKSGVLWSIEGDARAWMRSFLRHENPPGNPPMVAFLAVVVLAAEAMGNGEANANAYYAQLFKILKIEAEKDKTKLEGAYRESVLILWSYLNKWLTELEWAQGMPTAQALSFPYVSVAMSQALVREGDRRKMSRMFEMMNFTPGEYISPSEMTDFFNIWVQREDSNVSNSLKALWGKSSARERISEVLSKELEVWDGFVWGAQGTFGTNPHREKQHAKLKLTIKLSTYLGQSRIVHGLAFSSHLISNDTESTLYAKPSPEIPLVFQTVSKSVAFLQNANAVPLAALLLGDIEIAGPAPFVPVRRIPKDVVVLAFDEELQTYIEVEKAALGQDLLVLVKEQDLLMVNLQKLLEANARPGFKLLPKESLGLPSGWIAISRVQLIAAQASTFALRQFDALTPLASSQLVLSGGLKIPGPMVSKKFLASRAPELRAISQFANKVSVELHKSVWADDEVVEEKLQTWGSQNGTIFVDLADVIDEPGDYRVIFFEGGTATMQRDFYLRTGERPDAMGLRNIPNLGHSVESRGPKALFEAHYLNEDDQMFVRGASATFSYGIETEAGEFAGSITSWFSEDESVVNLPANATVKIPQVESDSCIYTGKHKRNLPMCTNGAKYVLGVCEYCLEQKPEYCNAYLATKKNTYEKLVQARISNTVNPIRFEQPVEIDFDEVLSLVTHVVCGKVAPLIHALEVLATDDMSALQILELLEQMGHVEVTRTGAGKLDEWSMVQPQVIFRPEPSRSALLGLWQIQDVANVSEILQDLAEANKPGIGIDFKTPDDVEESVLQISEAGYECGSAEEVVGSLLTLSWVRHNLKRTPLPNSDNVESFNLLTGKWEPVEHIKAGAVRIKGAFGARYFYLGIEDLSEDVGVSTSATIAKYLAANAEGISLIKYSKKHQSIFVPLGAKIPGLYGRGVLLASGAPPEDVVIKKGESRVKVTQYKNVPVKIAQQISKLLAE